MSKSGKLIRDTLIVGLLLSNIFLWYNTKKENSDIRTIMGIAHRNQRADLTKITDFQQGLAENQLLIASTVGGIIKLLNEEYGKHEKNKK